MGLAARVISLNIWERNTEISKRGKLLLQSTHFLVVLYVFKQNIPSHDFQNCG